MLHFCRSLAALLLLAALAVACGSVKVVPPSPTVIFVTPTPAPGATGQPSPEATVPTSAGEVGSRGRPVSKGEAYLMSTGWRVTVADFDPDVRTGLDFDGDGLEDSGPPAPGNKVFLVTLEANNVSAGNPGTFPYGFEQAFILGPGDTLYEISWPGTPGPLGDQVLEGGTLRGPLPFHVPEDATASIIMLGRGDEARFFSLE